MNGDVVAFLWERYDEEAQEARAAKPGPWHVEEDRQDLTRWVANEEGSLEVGLGYVGNRTQDDAAHIARHDPARVLRDVKAKRRIVELHGPGEFEYADGYVCMLCDRQGPEPYPCTTLRLLASVYADHPEFREEWKP